MTIKSKIVERGYIKFIDSDEKLKNFGLSNSAIDKIYPISKFQKVFHDKIGLEVNIKIITETPESCDIFCDGDESCIACNLTTAFIVDEESIIRNYKIDKING